MTSGWTGNNDAPLVTSWDRLEKSTAPVKEKNLDKEENTPNRKQDQMFRIINEVLSAQILCEEKMELFTFNVGMQI